MTRAAFAKVSGCSDLNPELEGVYWRKRGASSHCLYRKTTRDGRTFALVGGTTTDGQGQDAKQKEIPEKAPMWRIFSQNYDNALFCVAYSKGEAEGEWFVFSWKQREFVGLRSMHVAVVGTQDFHIDAAQALGEDLRSSSGMLPPAVVLSGARGVAARLNGGFVLVRASHAARRGSSRAEGLGETLLVYRKGEEGGRDGSTANPEEGVFLWRSEGTQIWHLSVSSSHPCADDPHLAVFKVTGGQAGTKGGEEGPGMPFGGEGVGTWWVWTGERFEEDPQVRISPLWETPCAPDHDQDLQEDFRNAPPVFPGPTNSKGEEPTEWRPRWYKLSSLFPSLRLDFRVPPAPSAAFLFCSVDFHSDGLPAHLRALSCLPDCRSSSVQKTLRAAMASMWDEGRHKKGQKSDPLVLCEDFHWSHMTPRPIFGKPTRPDHLWLPVIENCLASLCGSFAGLCELGLLGTWTLVLDAVGVDCWALSHSHSGEGTERWTAFSAEAREPVREREGKGEPPGNSRSAKAFSLTATGESESSAPGLCERIRSLLQRGCLVAVAAVSSSALAEGEADSEHVHKSSGEAPLTDTRLPSLFGLLSSHKLKRTRTGLVHGQPYPVVEVFEESEKGQQPSLGLILRDPFSAPPSSFSPLNCEDSAVGDSAKSGGTFSVRSGDLCLLFDRVFACAPGEPRREGCQTNGLETEEGLRGERREHSSISSEPGRYGRRESVEAEVQRAAPFSVHVQSPAEDVGQRADGLGSSGGERGVDPIMRMPVSAVSTAVGGGPPSAVEAHSDHSVLGFVASRLPTSEAALQTAAGVPGEEAMKRAERLAEEAAEMCAQGVEVHFALSEKNSGHSVGSRSHSINMSEGGVTSRGLKSRTNLTVSSSVNGEELSRSFEKVLKAQDQRHGQKLGNLLEGERGRERARSRLLDQSLLQPSFEQVLEARRRLYQ